MTTKRLLLSITLVISFSTPAYSLDAEMDPNCKVGKWINFTNIMNLRTFTDTKMMQIHGNTKNYDGKPGPNAIESLNEKVVLEFLDRTGQCTKYAMMAMALPDKFMLRAQVGTFQSNHSVSEKTIGANATYVNEVGINTDKLNEGKYWCQVKAKASVVCMLQNIQSYNPDNL